MAVIALLSAKGSPGVTTTMVALVRAWSAVTGRVALGLDLDACGGDVAAGVLLGSAPAGTGVLALATDRTRHPLEAVTAAAPVIAEGGCRILPGVPDAARAGAIPLAWEVITQVLPELQESGVDVLIDAGRVDGFSSGPVWLPSVDQGLLVVRPSLPWVGAAHRLAGAWPGRAPLGVVVVDAPSPYSAREVGRAVMRPVIDVLPFDARAASVHSDGARPERSHRRRAYSRAIDRLAARLVRIQEEPVGAARFEMGATTDGVTGLIGPTNVTGSSGRAGRATLAGAAATAPARERDNGDTTRAELS